MTKVEKSKVKGRVIKRRGMFIPQYKTSFWSGWQNCQKPGYYLFPLECRTLEEAIEELRTYKINGVVWEGLINEL